MSFGKRTLCFFAMPLMTLVSVSSANGDTPRLAHLFPAGGQRGATVTVTCHGEFSWPLNIWAPGASAVVKSEKGKIDITIPQDLKSDRIWIRLYDADGATAIVPFLVGSLVETNEIEPNDARDSSQPMREVISPPGDSRVTVNGVLSRKGDVDGFSVTLNKGQTLVAAVEANTPFGSPMDAILQVVTPDGIVLQENHDDVGLDPRLAFCAPESGVYIVRIFAFPAQPNQRIEFHGGENYIYRLTLTTGPYITHAVPMSAPRDEPGTVEVRGWNVPPGTRLPVVPLGSRSSQENPEYEVASTFRHPTAQLGIARAPAWSGSARIRLVDHPVLPGIANTTQQQPFMLSSPICVTGCLPTPNDTDYYHLTLQKDQNVLVSVEALALNLPLVPLVQLKDAAGKVVAEVTESGAAKDVALRYKASSDGVYLLTVRDRFQHGGGRYCYRLAVRAPVTDFELAVESDALILSADKPLEIPVTIKRLVAVGESLSQIEVTAVDLPSGVTCQPMMSDPKGDTAKKVTLTLETNGEPSSGWIRVRGVEKVLNKERFALTPARFRTCFDRIWLTVSKGKKDKS